MVAGAAIVVAGAGVMVALAAGVVALHIAGIILETHRQRGFSLSFAVGFSLATTASGISLGIGFKLGLLNPLVMLAVAGTSLPLAAMMIYPTLRRARLVAKYRKSEQQLAHFISVERLIGIAVKLYGYCSN